MRQIPLVLCAAALTLAAPALAQITVTSPTLVERTAAPGQTYTGTLRLHNGGTRTAEARIYRTDYRFQADGRTWYEAPGTLPRSNAAWVTPALTRVTLAPGEGTEVGYTVTVPPGSLPGGSYWSVVMVEGVEAGPPAPAAPGRVSMRSVLRYAVQLVTHLDGGAHRIAFADPRVAASETGGSVLEVDVRNEGEAADRLRLWAEVFDAAGTRVARVESQRGVLYPGTSLRQRFELGTLAAGDYRAVVVAAPEHGDAFGTEYTFRR